MHRPMYNIQPQHGIIRQTSINYEMGAPISSNNGGMADDNAARCIIGCHSAIITTPVVILYYKNSKYRPLTSKRATPIIFSSIYRVFKGEK